jgi:ferredoxin-thioredoxin reductase catalytic subunit
MVMNQKPVTQSEIDTLYDKLLKEAESGGYHLNPDIRFTLELVSGLIVNTNRYGYQACPCRIASGIKEEDNDIICPCDYRDADVTGYGCCYCGLYVSEAVANGSKEITRITERRPPPAEGKKSKREPGSFKIGNLPLPVWRCKVCGYLCARDGPPEQCPICKAKKDRFERFI